MSTGVAGRTHLGGLHKLLYKGIVERLVHVDALETIWGKHTRGSRRIYLDGAATLT